jgi:hypothetical protein
MDASLNLIDLQYLTNNGHFNKLMKKKNLTQISQNDLEFYKKRIFKLTKDMLLGEKINSNVNKSFEYYVNTCIDHFKFTDKMELIQDDYKNITSPKASKKSTFSMKQTNNLIYKQKITQHPKITDNIKIKSTKTLKPIIIPKTRTFNLKDARFREKGLKKKNINDI